jgi:type II secretory pathway pseudopilin PulG
MRNIIIPKKDKVLKTSLSPFFYSSFQSGFTVIETALVVGIFFMLVGIITVNLFKFQHTSQISSTLETFMADYKEQQIKAMVGDTDNTGTINSYGVHIESSSYTLFRSAYGTANFTVNVPGSITLSTTFPSSQVIFTAGSGEVSGFTSGSNTITFTDSVGGVSKVVTINRYGVISAVN